MKAEYRRHKIKYNTEQGFKPYTPKSVLRCICSCSHCCDQLSWQEVGEGEKSWFWPMVAHTFNSTLEVEEGRSRSCRSVGLHRVYSSSHAGHHLETAWEREQEAAGHKCPLSGTGRWNVLLCSLLFFQFKTQADGVTPTFGVGLPYSNLACLNISKFS